MAESEKLTALKKAYADIILNTAKEAAARIMVSERKAQRYQRELFAAKDEGLRMLLRLKQMLDFKVNEAEKSSLSQQRRIEELEAQLGEAEDIVKDLRSELRELQDELEKVTNRQMQSMDEKKLEDENATILTALEENTLDTSGCEIPSVPASHCDPVISLETANATLKEIYNGNMCYSTSDCCKDNCFACNPDFASIMMRSKEPELYRNGCTQRIRAFERSLLGENLSLSEKMDGVKEVFKLNDGGDKNICKKLIAEVDNISTVKKIPVLDKDATIRKRRRNMNQIPIGDGDKDLCMNPVVKVDRNCNPRRPIVVKDHGGNIAPILKRKRSSRQRKHRELEISSQEARDNNLQTQEDSETIIDVPVSNPQEVEILKSPSKTSEMVTESRSSDVIESKAECNGTSSLQTETTKVRLPIDELQSDGCNAGSVERSESPAERNAGSVERSESPAECNAGSVECSESPACKVACELPSNLELKKSVASDAVSAQPQSSYKYTFQRKRKKEHLGSPDGDSSLENHALKKNMTEKQNGSLELYNAGLSEDNQRLEQIADQLISLSASNGS